MNRDRVLDVCRNGAIRRRHSPLVVTNEGLRTAEGHHRLDRHHEPWLHPRTALPHPIVRHRRLFVHRTPDPVPGILLEDAEGALVLDRLLDRRPDLVQVAGGCEGGDSRPQRVLGHAGEALTSSHELGSRSIRNHHSERGIAVPAVHHRTAVDRNDVAGSQHPAAGDAMHDVVVH